MSGLEIMQAMMTGDIPTSPIAKTMPMEVSSVKKGNVIFSVKADGRHINPLGGVHGGFAATVMDSVTGCAIHTMLEPAIGYSTIDLNVKMLRPIPLNTDLIAEGNVINISKSIAVSEGVLRNSEGKIYAHSTATCMILRS